MDALIGIPAGDLYDCLSDLDGYAIRTGYLLDRSELQDAQDRYVGEIVAILDLGDEEGGVLEEYDEEKMYVVLPHVALAMDIASENVVFIRARKTGEEVNVSEEEEND